VVKNDEPVTGCALIQGSHICGHDLFFLQDYLMIHQSIS